MKLFFSLVFCIPSVCAAMQPLKAPKKDKAEYIPLSSQVNWINNSQVRASYDMHKKNLSLRVVFNDCAQRDLSYDANAQDLPLLAKFSNIIVYRLALVPNATRDILLILLAQKETESDTVIFVRNNLEEQILSPIAITELGKRFVDFRLFYNKLNEAATVKATFDSYPEKQEKHKNVVLDLSNKDEIPYPLISEQENNLNTL